MSTQSIRPLEGRVALITGVSRRAGIGFGVAKRLACDGVELFVQGWPSYDREQPWGTDSGGMKAILAEIRDIGGRAEHAEADFLNPAAPRLVVAKAVEAFGHIDILIVNHAYSTRHPAGALKTDSLSVEEIDRHLLVNVRASLLLVATFAHQHDGRPGGRVILMTSGRHLAPMPLELAYAASKGALHQLTASLSDALIDHGITVNTVNPGGTDTGWPSPEERQAVLSRLPKGRWGRPDDAARLTAWLVSDEAEWITGQVINSEGGVRRY